MTITTDVLRPGVNYLVGHVDREGTVTVVDVGRDDMHEAPLLITTWGPETAAEDGPFADPIFRPEFMARRYTPEENVRVMYVHEPTPDPDESLGEWRGVDFVADRSLRAQFRDRAEWYDHVDEGVDRLVELLA